MCARLVWWGLDALDIAELKTFISCVVECGLMCGGVAGAGVTSSPFPRPCYTHTHSHAHTPQGLPKLMLLDRLSDIASPVAEQVSGCHGGDGERG